MAKNNKINTENIDLTASDTGSTDRKSFDRVEYSGTGARQQSEASDAEKIQRVNEYRSQGRKGCKAPRMNICVSFENLQYIRIMSKMTGRTMSQFIGYVLAEHRRDHPEIYQDCKAIVDRLVREEADKNGD